MTDSPGEKVYQKRAYTVTIMVDGRVVASETTLAYEEDVAVMKMCAAVLLDQLGLDLERPLGLPAMDNLMNRPEPAT